MITESIEKASRFVHVVDFAKYSSVSRLRLQKINGPEVFPRTN